MTKTAPLRGSLGVYEPKTEPYDHQVTAFNRSVDDPYFALFMEQRTGKTKVEIDKAAYRFEHGEITALLIVAMPGLAHLNWITDEMPVHLPDRIPRLCLAWDASRFNRKSYQAQLEELLHFKGLSILSVNGEAIITENFRRYLGKFLKARQRVQVTADETTLIMKTPGTRRTKVMHAIGAQSQVKFKSILDGTPVGEGPLDLFAQCQFLAPGLLGHTSFFSYKNYFAEWEEGYDPRTGKRFPKLKQYRNLSELSERLKKFSYRVLRRDCFDLPEKIYVPRHRFDLSKEQRRIYDELTETYQAEFSDGLAVTASNVLTRMLRQQQITSNYWPAVEGIKICPACEGDGCEACDGLGSLEVTLPSRRIDPDHHPRIETLEEQLLLKPDDRNIIWCRFQHDVDDVMKLCEKLGRTPVQFDGRRNRQQKTEAKEAFQKKLASDLVGSARAGGRALKIAADSIHYYSNEFPLLVRLQSEDRAEFKGMEHGTGVHDYEAVDSVDEIIVEALRAKRSVVDYIMEEKSGVWI